MFWCEYILKCEENNLWGEQAAYRKKKQMTVYILSETIERNIEIGDLLRIVYNGCRFKSSFWLSWRGNHVQYLESEWRNQCTVKACKNNK